VATNAAVPAVENQEEKELKIEDQEKNNNKNN
jgi:hypothetical protein